MGASSRAAALGLALFANPNVPVRIRRALNVESGLNDGIVTPFVTLFIAFAAATETQAQSSWLGAALMLAVFCFNLLGDGLRDIVDPRIRRSR